LADGTVHIDRGRIQLPSGVVHVDGEAHVMTARGDFIHQPHFRAKIGAPHVELADLSDGNVGGVASATITAEGTPSKYHARALIAVPGVIVRGATLALARVDVEGDQHRLRLNDLLVRPVKGGVLVGKGTFDVAMKSFTGRIAGHQLPLSLISDATSAPPVAGVLDFVVLGDGTIAKPHFKATLSTTTISVDQQEIGRLRARADGGLDRIAVAVRLEGDDQTLALNTRIFPDEKRVEGRFASHALKLRRLLLLADQDIALGGDIGADVFFSGPLPYPDLKGGIWLTGLELDGDPVPGGGTSLRLSTAHVGGDKHYRIEANIIHAVAIQADLEPTPIPIRGKVTASIDDLQLEKLVPSIKERGIVSHVHGQAVLEFGAQAPRGSLVLDRLSAQFAERSIQAAEPIRIDFADSNVVIKSFVLRGSEGNFVLTGHAGHELALSARGVLELGFVEPLVPQLAEATGGLRLAVDLAGTPSSPTGRGTISIETPIDVRPRGSIRVFHLEKADISIVPTLVTIHRLSGAMGSGTFNATGTISLAGFKPASWDVSVTGQSISLSTPEFVIDADARLHATGRGPVPSISGEVVIVRGRYTKQFTLDRFNFIAKRNDEEDQNAPREQAPWLDAMRLDIRALSTGTINVRVDAQAFSANVELTANLRVRGSAAQPRIDGRVAVESGEMSFPSAKLPVTGAIDFVPRIDQPIRPVIDITAEGDVRGAGADGRQRDFHITMSLTGTLNQIGLDLQAPDLPDRTEILSLLITGNADVMSIAQGGSSGDAQPLAPGLAFAGSQLAAPATRFLQQQLERQLNLQLELRTEVTSEGFRVVAGKEITRRIHIEGGYGRSFLENTAVASTTATLHLTDRFFFEGSAQTINAFGSSVAALQEGAAGRLELKLRVFGSDQ
jgi:autotransporter translocation and assembly factor TamB